MIQAVISFIGIFVVWCFWLYACALGSEAHGGSGSTSILPGIPVFPLFFWFVLLALNSMKANLGNYVVGIFHVLFLISLVIGCIRFWWMIKNKAR